MPNTQNKAHNPLSVPANSIGRGLALILPETPKEMLEASPTIKEMRKLEVAGTNSDWLAPFISEHALTGEHAPRGIIALTHEGGIYRLHAQLRFSPQMECARCLELFRQSFSSDTKAIYTDHNRFSDTATGHRSNRSRKSTDDWTNDEGLSLSGDDLDIYEFTGSNISVEECMLDAMQLEIPDVPLCDAECPGLCTECGNINAPKHTCRPRS